MNPITFIWKNLGRADALTDRFYIIFDKGLRYIENGMDAALKEQRESAAQSLKLLKAQLK